MKKISYGLAVIITFLAGMIIAKAGYSFSVNTTSVYVGSYVTATLKLTNVAAWEVHLSASGATSCSKLDAADATSTGTNGSKTYTLKCKATKAGTIKFTLGGTSNITTASGVTTYMSGTKTVTAKTKVVTQTTKSAVNYLSSLSITEASLSPSFDKDVDTYTVTLEPNTTSIKINAKVLNAASSVKGAGVVPVTDGLNTLKVVVTAENGATRTYTIKATVKELDPIMVELDDITYTIVRKKELLPLASVAYEYDTVEIGDGEIPSLYSRVSGTTLVGLQDSEGSVLLYVYKKGTYTKYIEFVSSKIVLAIKEVDTIPEGYHESSITINDERVTCYKNDSSEYVLLYGTNEKTGNTGFYSYDEKEETIQRYIVKTKKYYMKIVAGLILVIVIVCIASAIEGTIAKMNVKKAKKGKTSKKEKDFKEKIEDEINIKSIPKKEKEELDVNKVDIEG